MVGVLVGYENLTDLLRLVSQCLKCRNIVENFVVPLERCPCRKSSVNKYNLIARINQKVLEASGICYLLAAVCFILAAEQKFLVELSALK